MADPVFQFASDIRMDNAAYVHRGILPCRLSALGYDWNGWEPHAQTTMESLARIMMRPAGRWPALEPWLFIGNAAWWEDNRVTRYKTLSKQLGTAGLPAAAVLMAEAVIESTEGIRHLGLIRCTGIAPADLGGLLRSGYMTQLVFAEAAQALKAADTLLAADWGQPGPIHVLPAAVAGLLCELDVLAYRPFGWFDDRESGGILAGRQHLLARLYPEIGTADDGEPA